ncbi:MAG: site-specific integrase [Paraprevotella sp.]|nr:site-specific integrase [Paraprevotella sp.]
MATVKIKWRPSAIDGKAGTIYYQIIHNRVVRQLKTDYKIFDEERNDVLRMIVTTNTGNRRMLLLRSIQERIDWDVKRLNLIIERFDKTVRSYTADDIISAFTNQSQDLSFFNFMQGVIIQLKVLNRYRTAENYITALNSFIRFRDNEDLLLSELDSDLMMRYEAYLVGRCVAKNTISFYMRILRAVYNRAVEQELTERRNPFKHVYTGVDKTVKRAISFAAIKRIKELDLLLSPALDFSRDMFLFSFYTRGMSFVDMAYLKKTDLKNGVITYRRRKTGQLLSIKWERCMQEIIAKYENENTYRHIPNGNPFLLPILKPPFDNNRKSMYRCVLQQINKALKTIAKLAKLDVPLTMYVARHSWASVAKSKNIPISIISDGLGHDSETTTQIYLASLDTTIVDRANRLILKGL